MYLIISFVELFGYLLSSRTLTLVRVNVCFVKPIGTFIRTQRVRVVQKYVNAKNVSLFLSNVGTVVYNILHSGGKFDLNFRYAPE